MLARETGRTPCLARTPTRTRPGVSTVHRPFGKAMSSSCARPGSRADSGRLVELQMVQLGVDAAELQQLLLGAVFYHQALLDDDDLVRVAQGAEAMGDRDD